MLRTFLGLISLGCILFSAKGAAEPAVLNSQASQILKVGGEFKISKIEKLGVEDFRVLFDSIYPSGKNDRLILRTQHLHFGLAEGSQIRLSAEVISASEGVLEVTQVLLFLPRENYGLTPVWVLSSQFPNSELKGGAKWLEMHAPQADFEIM